MGPTGRSLDFTDLQITRSHRRGFRRGGEASDERFAQRALPTRPGVDMIEELRGSHWKTSNGGLD